jgi:hypothetical protein
MLIKKPTPKPANTFASLRVGDVFGYTGQIYMKVMDYGIPYNTLNLATGSHSKTPDAEPVIPYLFATLNVEPATAP